MYKKCLSAVILATFCVVQLHASAGTLDTTFNPSGTPPGTATVVVGISGSDRGNGVALQQDGKIVVVGQAMVGGTLEFGLARFNADGSVDTTFGTAGTVTTPIGTSAEANGVALQADGKIVVVGLALIGSNNQIVVARYTSAGVLDATFGTGGIQITPIGTGDDGFAVVIQPDGKIVVAGGATIGTGQFAVVRYTSNGSLDTSFNGTGFVTTPIGADAQANAVALQQDGNIVVAGFGTVSGSEVFAVARYTSAGVLDTTFGTGGVVTTPIGTIAQAQGVAVQTDGKIVAFGFARVGGNTIFALTRYTSAGVLDTTFGTGGIVTTVIEGSTFARGNAVALQQNGKIVVTGQLNTSENFAIARYTTAGALDTTFNSQGTQPGVVTTIINNAASQSFALALQSDGKIVAAGQAAGLFAVARYNGDPVNPCVARFINKYGFVV